MKSVIRRIVLSLAVLVTATAIVFFGLTLIGDPLGELRGDPHISEEALQRLIDAKHLDEPVWLQYGYWLSDVFTNRLGTDLKYDRPIWPELSRALGNTLQLVIAAEAIAIVVALIVGVLAARFQYSPFDYLSTLFSFIGHSVPIFWLALVFQIVVVNLFEMTGTRIFYISGQSSVDPGTGLSWFVDRLQHLALPILVLSVSSIASHSRYVRASMLEVINSDYLRTARAKGLNESTIMMRHALRNAALPLITVVGVSIGNMFNGTILIETIFSIPGMGLYFLNALNARDIYSTMGWLLLTATVMLLMNVLADLLYGVLDPRIRR